MRLSSGGWKSRLWESTFQADFTGVVPSVKKSLHRAFFFLLEVIATSGAIHYTSHGNGKSISSLVPYTPFRKTAYLSSLQG